MGLSRDDALLVTPIVLSPSGGGNYRNVFGILKTGSPGASFQMFDLNPKGIIGEPRAPQFTPDGNTVVYAVAGQKNRLVARRKKLLVARGHAESDVILLRDTSK